MLGKNKELFFAISTLIGTIVGVGVFGIPYVTARSGFFIAVIYFFILAILTLLVHLFLGEIALRTRGRHHLVGYCGIYLGKQWKKIITFSIVLGLYGSLTAYIIVSGKFLFTLFNGSLGGTELIYSLVVFFVGAIALLFGLKMIAEFEFLMTLLLFFTVIIILIAGIPFIQTKNLLTFNASNIFLPYGVILFSLLGGSAIPEIKEILIKKRSQLKKAIITGSLISAILTFLFVLVVVGVTGLNTSEEAIKGLEGILGNSIIFLGAVFGFLAVFTSFLILGLDAQKIFWYDYGIKKYVAWLLAISIPLFIFLFGSQSFIQIIGITGAVFGGFDGLMIVLIYIQAKKRGKRVPEYSLKTSPLLLYLMMFVFVLGIIYEIYYLIK